MSIDTLRAPAGSEAIHETIFYIPATGPAARPRRTLKRDDTFLVVDAHGDIGASAGGPDGLFHHDTRFLSRLEVLVNGVQLLLLGSNVRDDNAVLKVDLTNPDLFRGDRRLLEKDTLHIDRTIFLSAGTAFQRLALRNYGADPVELAISVTFDSDFADLFEARGMHRRRRGTTRRNVNGLNEVVFTYTGLDHVVRTTGLHFDPVPTRISQTGATYDVRLAPKETATLLIAVRCNPETAAPMVFLKSLHEAHRSLREVARGRTSVETSNPMFNQVLSRSMADLSMLTTETAQGPYPYAGTPWYSTTFGRDGLITAMEMLWIDPRIARGVLTRLAAFQANTCDADSDAEPGKILHEMRDGEMARLGEVPFRLYYGSIDSTPLFVMLTDLYVEQTGDIATLESLWPAVEAGLSWMKRYGDRDADGFLEYARANEHGLANQGWKDSVDSIFHEDGRLAEGPIALAEVQAYAFAAKRAAARCARRLGVGERAATLEAEARTLAEQFEREFWCADLGLYALALDGDKQPCRVRTSNAGQVLFSGIAGPDRARIVVETLMKPEFFSGWGIRTVSSREVRYNPMSYHNGSIWPHDNALIALGFARYGAKQPIDDVLIGMFDAAAYMDFARLPELFCGFRRSPARGPTLYPVACSPQAWAAAAPFCLLQAALGLELDAAACQVRLRNPLLPSFLDEIVLRNLQVGSASADIALHRRGSALSLHVIETRGDVEVAMVRGGLEP